jgi:TIR domain
MNDKHRNWLYERFREIKNSQEEKLLSPDEACEYRKTVFEIHIKLTLEEIIELKHPISVDSQPTHPNETYLDQTLLQSAMNNSVIEVFISYSHKDDELREELVIHLASLRRQGKIEAWHDRAIEAGEEWEAQIKGRLESAQIILLLISPPFIASDYCFDVEMQRAIARHHEGTARVIPIILRPSDWKESPFSKLQVLPKDAKPVTQWDDRDSAFLDVVQGLRRAVDSLTKK